jgi:GTP-binding protein HflX
LFATLDTTSRKLWIEGAGNIVISDTVGFIRDLPHSLVDAFHATLEAAIDADLPAACRRQCKPRA